MNVYSSIHGEWKFEQIGCDMYGYGMGFLSFVTISTIALMTIERFILVKSPLTVLKYQEKLIFGKKKLFLIFKIFVK